MVTLHGTAVARAGAGVLLLGASGAGKSDLALRLMGLGFVLVADDQVEISGLSARAPAALAGLLEVRGLGIVRMPFVSADLVLAVRAGAGERLPQPARLPDLDLPLISIDFRAASAPQRIALALDCLEGGVALVAGAFT